MNTVLVPTGLPVVLVHASSPSGPNHPAAPATAFALVHAFALLVAAGQRTLPSNGSRGKSSPGGHGAGFAQRSQARRSARPNRAYDVACSTCHAITDGLFNSGSFPPRVATTQHPSVTGGRKRPPARDYRAGG